MRLENYINEVNTDKLNKIQSVFQKIPNDSPESIANYVVNTFKILGIKPNKKGCTYLSGPMTNLPDDNWPTFINAGKYLKGKVINPADPHGKLIKKSKKDFKWMDYMTEDLYGMLECDKIVLLPGYSRSTGAIVEVVVGKKLLGIKPKLFRDVVGESKYMKFVKEVKEQYISDGNEKGYYSTIEPMLLSKSEIKAAKHVVQFMPESTMNEGITDIIKNIGEYIKNITSKGLLKLIGMILNKSGIRKLT
jgi:hypothetical protein